MFVVKNPSGKFAAMAENGEDKPMFFCEVEEIK